MYINKFKCDHGSERMLPIIGETESKLRGRKEFLPEENKMRFNQMSKQYSSKGIC